MSKCCITYKMGIKGQQDHISKLNIHTKIIKFDEKLNNIDYL